MPVATVGTPVTWDELAEVDPDDCTIAMVPDLLHRRTTPFDIAAAKRTAARSVPEVIANIHQVHGAIGTTSECGLAELTLRMSAWCSEYGTDAYWSGVLTAACADNDIWDVVIGGTQ